MKDITKLKLTETEYFNELKKHCETIKNYIDKLITILSHAAETHDDSKFSADEFYEFNKYFHLMKSTEYNSKEYKAQAELLSPTLQKHYKHNSHHPQYHINGISGMTVIDLIEMICDWKAACSLK